MITVTGIGRSGTSFLARIYRELGFDPGGTWEAPRNAGLEAQDVVRANRAIMWDLGVGLPLDEGLERDRLVWVSEGIEARRVAQSGDRQPGRVLGKAASVVPGRLYDFIRGRSSWIAASVRATARDPLRRRRSAPRAVKWDRYREVVETHRSRINSLARSHQIVKDPRFCWTLGVWAEAGARIDHVLVCVRHLEAIMESRSAADLSSDQVGNLPNTLIYGLGLCFADIHTHRLEHDIVRFPDFLDDPERLFESMRFPAPVERDRFLRIFARLADQGSVHDWR